MRKTIITALMLTACLFFAGNAVAKDTIKPDGTYKFATKDSCDLLLDLYLPADGSETSIDGKSKPTIVFIFGGGFKSGKRNEPIYLEWFKEMTDRGYGIISIDYRLGLKHAEMKGLRIIKLLHGAINLAVEDLFSAISFIIENGEALGVDPANLVLAGSSAGAITALQADYELCNHTGLASELPEDFRFAGIMSFSGAVFTDNGVPGYTREPAPTLMLHGTRDKIVEYRQIWFFNYRFAGADVLTSVFKKNSYNYNTLRYKERGHEICISMMYNLKEQEAFLEHNVMGGEKRIIDSFIDDPSIPTPEWTRMKGTQIYD